jgi:hypothetical protein
MDKMNLAHLAEKFVVTKQKFHKRENVQYHGNPLFLYRRAPSVLGEFVADRQQKPDCSYQHPARLAVHGLDQNQLPLCIRQVYQSQY